MCLLYGEFGLLHTVDKHFKLSHSGAVQLSPKLYLVSTQYQKGQSQWL